MKLQCSQSVQLFVELGWHAPTHCPCLRGTTSKIAYSIYLFSFGFCKCRCWIQNQKISEANFIYFLPAVQLIAEVQLQKWLVLGKRRVNPLQIWFNVKCHLRPYAHSCITTICEQKWVQCNIKLNSLCNGLCQLVPFLRLQYCDKIYVAVIH